MSPSEGLLRVPGHDAGAVADHRGDEFHRRSVFQSTSLSVVIPVFNAGEMLRHCLASLTGARCQAQIGEVILIDNASSDNAIERAQSEWGSELPLRVIRLTSNRGFAVACNHGVAVSSKEFVLFLNQDAEAGNGSVDALLSVLTKQPAIGAAQGMILQKEAPSVIDAIGGAISPHGVTTHLGQGEKNRGQYDEIRDVFYACGAALITRRSLFASLGGFDPATFLYYEDVDYCWRVWLSGRRVVYVPGSYFYHAQHTRRNARNACYLAERNRVRSMLCNYSGGNLVRSIPQAWCIMVGKLILAGAMWRWKSAAYLMAAWVWNLWMLPNTLQRRVRIQRRIRRVDDSVVRALLRSQSLKSGIAAFCARMKRKERKGAS